MKNLLSPFLVLAILCTNVTHILHAQCSLEFRQITKEDNGTITVTGQLAGGTCNEVEVSWTTPSLPSKTTPIPDDGIWNVQYTSTDGITADILKEFFECREQTGIELSVRCLDQNCQEALTNPTIECKNLNLCPDEIAIVIRDADGNQVNPELCLPAGDYTATINAELPSGGDFFWAINNDDVDPSEVAPFHLDAGGEVLINFDFFATGCHRQDNIELVACQCHISDIDAEIDTCDLATGMSRVVFISQVSGIPGETLHSTLTVTNSAGVIVASDEKSETTGQYYLMDITDNLPEGDYTAQVIILSPVSCTYTLRDILTIDSCSIIDQDPIDDGVNTDQPPVVEVPPSGPIDWCCIFIFIIIGIIMVAAIATYFAVCAPNPGIITFTLIIWGLAVALLIAWLIFCPFQAVGTPAFCDLLNTFIFWLGIVEMLFIVVAAVIWILIASGVIVGLCAGWASLIDAAAIGFILGILTTIAGVAGCLGV